MIPLKLQLKNFLSYGPTIQTIDFGNYPLICLSGKNGHGKSALLDAITWAIWGQARKISGASKPDAQLLRLGQKHMLVIFEFFFNGQNYKIRREFAITQSGKHMAVLEFGILNPETKTIQPLTDKTIRETQKHIEATIGIDFESFSNSAFLRQGSANEFSKKSPKDRKEILASILQLDHFEKIRKRASEKVKETQNAIAIAQNTKTRIEQELKQIDTIELTLKTIEEKLHKTNNDLKNHEKKQTTLNKQKEALTKQEHTYKMITYQLEESIKLEKSKQEQIQELFVQWRTIHKKLRQMENPKKLNAKLEQLNQRIAWFVIQQQEQLEAKSTFLQKKDELRSVLQLRQDNHAMSLQKKQAFIEQLELNLAQSKTKCSEFVQQLETVQTEQKTLQTTLEKAKKKEAEEKQKLEQVKPLQEQFEKRKHHYHRWYAQAHLIKTEIAHIDQKKDFVEDQTNPSCPLCEQNLSASRKRFLKQQFEKQEHLFRHKLKRFETIVPALKKALMHQHEMLEAFTKKKEELTLLAQTIKNDKNTLEKITDNETTYKNKIEQIKKEIANQEAVINKTVTEKKNEKKEYEKNIQNDPIVQEKQKELTALEKKINFNQYNQAEHKKTLTELTDLHEQQNQHAQLIEQGAQQDQRKRTFSTLCIELKKIKKEKQTLTKKQKEAAQYKKEETLLLQEFKNSTTQMQTLQTEKENLIGQQGKLEAQQQTLEKQKIEYSQQEKVINTLTETMSDYQTLAVALGKDGVQALLIEDALPEIEQETNQLLAKLTNNQAHVIIESLRDLKKGGTKETLDIKISDPIGIRPYELFSGGEAFRIDFALRIAISKLLARRAGTSLQTLIIDEGFGSQDEEGLGYLMDAIHKIQEHFAKVIIVSHLPAMKDQFPIHFMVHKGPDGSHVQVVENG